MQRSMLARILLLGLFVWACAILWLSSLSPDEMPGAAFVFWDKINHVVAFAVGGWLAASALGMARPAASTPGRLVVAVVIIAAFGAMDEGVQSFTPGRTGADVTDWIADVIGAAAGATLSLATVGRLERLVGS